MAIPLVIGIALQAAATASAPLSPDGKWEVSYNKNDCTLARRFTGSEQSNILGFKPAMSLDAGSLVIIREHQSMNGVHRGGGKVRLLPSGKTFPIIWGEAGIPERGATGMNAFLVSGFWDALPQAQSLIIEPDHGPKTEYLIGSLNNAWPTVVACRNDLLFSMGIDPAAMIKPGSQIAGMFSYRDYPSAAIKLHQEGRVVTVTTIDPSGRPIRCRVMQSSGSESLDQTTCLIMEKRGHFAKAPNGPAERQIYGAVRWLLPRY